MGTDESLDPWIIFRKYTRAISFSGVPLHAISHTANTPLNTNRLSVCPLHTIPHTADTTLRTNRLSDYPLHTISHTAKPTLKTNRLSVCSLHTIPHTVKPTLKTNRLSVYPQVCLYTRCRRVAQTRTENFTARFDISEEYIVIVQLFDIEFRNRVSRGDD